MFLFFPFWPFVPKCRILRSNENAIDSRVLPFANLIAPYFYYLAQSDFALFILYTFGRQMVPPFQIYTSLERDKERLLSCKVNYRITEIERYYD